ncbi:hypothetical protein HGRIS_000630 [Hohenbuehelia grisea]|uniref:Uncharacterized protein n=1 Tax=Hohenbuehelia grisea TaxID=104357 RepID=A0ABR3JSE4_9AGAR
MWPLPLPLNDASFNLDVSGIAGFFGGEEAISAMASVHIYNGRKWLGWYNSPGSYTIARKYGQLANSRLWDGLYPGVNVDPAIMLELDGKSGPKYQGLVSGTRMDRTGHLASLFAAYCRDLKAPKVVDGRKTTQVGVTVVQLTGSPPAQLNPTLTKTLTPLIALIAIGANLATCVVSAIFAEWYSFAMILLGILCNGFSCLVIGSGELVFKHPEPPKNAPRGDGFLLDDDQVIILKGPEGAITAITRGQFLLHYTSETQYHDIGLSSVALTLQFLLQLFIIPQAHLFGQILFLLSLAASYAYNAYLSSIDKECLQQDILIRVLETQGKPLAVRKFILPNRTAMSVFSMLTALPKETLTHPTDAQQSLPSAVLTSFIPNNTPMWQVWRHVVLRDVQRIFLGNAKISVETLRAEDQTIFSATPDDTDKLDEGSKGLLHTLLLDARAGFGGYLSALDTTGWGISETRSIDDRSSA